MQKTRLNGKKKIYTYILLYFYIYIFDQMFGLRFLRFWFLVHFCWFLFL